MYATGNPSSCVISCRTCLIHHNEFGKIQWINLNIIMTNFLLSNQRLSLAMKTYTELDCMWRPEHVNFRMQVFVWYKKLRINWCDTNISWGWRKKDIAAHKLKGLFIIHPKRGQNKESGLCYHTCCSNNTLGGKDNHRWTSRTASSQRWWGTKLRQASHITRRPEKEKQWYLSDDSILPAQHTREVKRLNGL